MGAMGAMGCRPGRDGGHELMMVVGRGNCSRVGVGASPPPPPTQPFLPRARPHSRVLYAAP
jgi:dihydroxyacetone kinase